MKKYLFYLLALTVFMVALNACDDSDDFEIEKKEDVLSEEVSNVRNWYIQSSIKNNHSLLQYSEKLDWSNAVITCSAIQNIVEVPIITGDKMTLYNPEQPELNVVSRMLFFGKNNS